ncbi:hypothetical protein FSP39_007919 [Pinctada imbricata]|uniref:Potassium channel subfamily K member 1 n=1 Tax=Pinctada imbricata TaxID=66713 RepID=A0AA88XVW1_PINIB|nr:hypothetical protein FSP39_007919 [Pinctada imbricata]
MGRIIDCCCGTSAARMTWLVIVFVSYVCLGAFTFSYLEREKDEHFRRDVMNHIDKFKSDHHCIDDKKLEELIITVVKATNRGVAATRNVTMTEPNWTFGQSIFFASTILTTIGYGRVTPLSDAGKGFCILYAVIGIPLTLILFTAVVERLMIPTKIFLYFLFRKLGHLYKVFHIQLFHFAILLAVVLIFIFLVPAAIYCALEPNWNYLDSFYYCFISMTTIGLGDYIPGDNPEQKLRPFYKVATTVYLFLGLTVMMLLLAVLYDIPELNLGFHFYMKSDEQEDERTKLRDSIDTAGPKYTAQIDEDPRGGKQGGSKMYQPTEQDHIAGEQ